MKIIYAKVAVAKLGDRASMTAYAASVYYSLAVDEPFVFKIKVSCFWIPRS